jgi:hypothetical protein
MQNPDIDAPVAPNAVEGLRSASRARDPMGVRQTANNMARRKARVFGVPLGGMYAPILCRIPSHGKSVMARYQFHQQERRDRPYKE